MPVATLAELKALLGIPAGDTSKDAALAGVLSATEAWALDRAGYSLTDLTARIDTFENVRLSYPVLLTKRPVSAVTLVEGRILGDATYQALQHDLVDPARGKLKVLGTDFYVGGSYGEAPWGVPRRPNAFRWRESIWPVVRVTYNVSKTDPAPADFKQGVVAAAAAIHGNQSRAGLASLSVGNVSESYEKAAASAGALGFLMPHFRDLVRTAL